MWGEADELTARRHQRSEWSDALTTTQSTKPLTTNSKPPNAEIAGASQSTGLLDISPPRLR